MGKAERASRAALRLPHRTNAARTGFWRFCVCFFLCAFVGWVYETALIRALWGVWMNRGLLMTAGTLQGLLPALERAPSLGGLPVLWGLPVIPIYGFGGALVCLALQPVARRTALVFFAGFFGLSLFELAASYFCEYVIGEVYWDYSAEALNFDGRICLASALVWGVLAVLAVRLLAPLVNKLYNKLRSYRHANTTLATLCAFAAFCAVCKYALGYS